ncbi:MAG TPA: transcription-repair coupling factor [Acidocella sp.]|jgi:transcription-repair coupling factor (superfamily II helicase)|uniref:transcription-repair coupling factor n=1 Tax=Acidocella sp. TaxID=50710 RepID=UPI002C8F2321|nr:transcription-repair coupling factor [Acidocella sp.]HVE20870.1 transcription-repair coupling factor [Acidocella sp.]
MIPIYGVPEGVDALALVRRWAEQDAPVLHIARDDSRLAGLQEAIGFFGPEIEVISFPAWDCLPYDRVSPNGAIVAERIAALSRLQAEPKRKRIVLTTINAALQRVAPRAALQGAGMRLAVGDSVSPEDIAAFLDADGYRRTGTVMDAGEYALRGGIIDVFPAGEAAPVRIDLFGDTIESIRRFDPETQRSGEATGQLDFHPASEIAFDQAAVARFRSAWREIFGAKAVEDPLYEAVSEGRRHAGLEHYAPLFSGEMETIFDYVPNASVSLDYQMEAAVAARLELIADHYAERRGPARAGEQPYRPIAPELLYLDQEAWDAVLNRSPCFSFSPFSRPDGAEGVDFGGRPGPILAGQNIAAFEAFAELRGKWASAGRSIVLAAWSAGSRERLTLMLREHGLREVRAIATADEARALPKGTVGLAVLGIERGFLTDRLALVAEQDLLGNRIARPPKRRKRADQFIADATEIAAGDLVVHQDHGIGRYDGLETVTVNGAAHDCLRLLYDGGDKLFLPVENIDLLSRFGQETDGVSLDKLGGASWQARKAKAKNRIQDMAAGLIRLAAERQTREAPLIAPEEGAFAEFCARFPYTETEDQAKAISDVLEDFAAGKPMDRLVCGDVGFGKTEVALRAAFVAAMAGSQVAVVVPTTLLARQHYRAFSARFAGLPIKVAQLSRMVTAKEAASTRVGLADGSISIVIGTHALMAKGVSFSDLGLLIVDEEQHFGVAHKERLKQLKADVHVLTLTATPIPRTLQLALTGVRDLSLITTPPVDRLAVRTFIMPFDSLVIKEAIAREKFRGGQIFCVVPRIEDLEPMAARLREIAPDIRTVIAHGRLAPTELERVMTEFGEGKFDVLLATNIVESGLDMPAVNTLIIYRADMFGLAGLYQLRGRVGRGKQRGYAYLTWPAHHVLSAAATKRLEVMQTLDTLGAGFTLASHDLDLRGAGNLLGDEQSGHIREVGIELYQQMLEDAVNAIRAEGKNKKAAERDWTPNINLGLPVLIPDSYVSDLPVRLGLYRRISALTSDAESEALAVELGDRFGKLPVEVENLLETVALKRACREAGVEKLDAGPKGMVISFRKNEFNNPAGLLSWIASRGGTLKVRPDQKLVVARDMDVSARVGIARDVLRNLVKLANLQEAA